LRIAVPVIHSLGWDRQLAFDGSVISDRSGVDADTKSRHEFVEEAVVMIRMQNEHYVGREIGDLGPKTADLAKESSLDFEVGPSGAN
jgi:hypothetical protein